MYLQLSSMQESRKQLMKISVCLFCLIIACKWLRPALYMLFWKENENVTIVCTFVPFDQLMGNKMFPSLQSVNLVHNAISSQRLCILSQMEVRDGLLYFPNINKVKIHYTSTVITHSQAQSLPLKCHRLTVPNCWVHKVYTPFVPTFKRTVHFQACTKSRVH